MQFNLQNPIGQPGGFGQVYRCTDEHGNIFALKFLTNMSGDAPQRFEREIRLLDCLNHPNVIKIIAYNINDAQKFYVMPLYNYSLEQLIPTIQNNSFYHYSVISRILDAVAYLHSEGVIHRDLKPANILCNNVTDIVITDFGLSIQHGSASATLTRFLQGGSPRYASPEQMMDLHDVDCRADIYALGFIIEDIITNYGAISITDPTLLYIIEKCTKNRREDRFSSIQELKTIVDAYYSALFNWNRPSEIDELLLKLENRTIQLRELENLTTKLLNTSDVSHIEKFFIIIDATQYSSLEKGNQELFKNLIKKVCEYWTQSTWTFSYIDTIANTISKLFLASNNPVSRALLLYTLIDLANNYNRWYAMGIAKNLIPVIDQDFALQSEFSSLLSKRLLSFSTVLPDNYTLPTMIQTLYN